MAAVVLHGNVSLEVHLPELVGFGTLKAHIGCVLGSLGFIDEPMSSENGSDRALGRHARIAAILQHPGQHMRTLGGMRLAQRYDAFLSPGSSAADWSAGAWEIVKALPSGLRVPPQPLVAGLAADFHDTTRSCSLRQIVPEQ